jgi:ABC-type sugar transport system substrate-binding protein
MLSRRKSLAVLAAALTALAAAAPAASASTARAPSVDPTVCLLLNISENPFGPGMFPGGASLISTLQTAGNSVGCPALSPQQLLFPFGQPSLPSVPLQSATPLAQQSGVPVP